MTKYIYAACSVAVTICLCLTLVAIRAKVKAETVTSIDGAQINAAISAVKDSVTIFKNAEQEQADDYDPKKPGSIPNQIFRLIEDTKTAVGKTDLNLNGGPDLMHRGVDIPGVLPELAKGLASTNQMALDSDASVKTVTGQLVTDLGSLDTSLGNLGTASAAVAAQTPPLLSHLNDAATSSAVATDQMAQATANVNGISKDAKDIADKIHDDFMHPVHRAWYYIRQVLGIASDAGNASKI